ncbi:MAG TPA: glycosyltransferase [Cyclobacteriaceae bacterium]|nr:glycosyltransferase [Cyclobacteriaceae bacterium]
MAIQYPYTHEEYLWNGNRVIPFNSKIYKSIARPLVWIKAYRALKTLHKDNSLVGVLSFWCLETALIGKYFCKKFLLPHFIWILGQDARKKNKWVRWIKPEPAKLIALSAFLQHEFDKNHGIKPAHVVPNGVDPSLYRQTIQPKTIDILGVGSLVRLKQYDVFIEIISKLKAVIPGLKVALCGKGVEEMYLHRLARELNVHENIEFKGELPHKDILTLMQASRILLHPSSYEGYSTVSLEALYAGCHVVSFTFPEEREIKHWHVCKNQKEMEHRCLAILKNETDFSSQDVHLMPDSAIKIMNLYSYPK